jgi:hypothetical protein
MNRTNYNAFPSDRLIPDDVGYSGGKEHAPWRTDRGRTLARGREGSPRAAPRQARLDVGDRHGMQVRVEG